MTVRQHITAVIAIGLGLGAYAYSPMTSTTAHAPLQPATIPVRRTLVLLDARPWANFRIAPLDANSPQEPIAGTTPTTVHLVPGAYIVDLENGGVTKPLPNQRLDVAETPVDRTFVMPGFNAEAIVNSLLGSDR